MLIEFECSTIAPLLREEEIAQSKALHIRHKEGKVWLTGSASSKRPKPAKVEDLDPGLLPLDIMPHCLEDRSGGAERVRIRVRNAEKHRETEVFFSFVPTAGA